MSSRVIDPKLYALQLFAAKAPVNYPGPQRIALRAFKLFEFHLTELERRRIFVAWNHAITGEGRGELDQVMSRIKDRLFKECRTEGLR